MVRSRIEQDNFFDINTNITYSEKQSTIIKEINVELPIDIIRPINYIKNINILTFLQIKQIETNAKYIEFEIYLLLMNPTNSKTLYLQQLCNKTYVKDAYKIYIKSDFCIYIKISIQKIDEIIKNIKIDTYNECFIDYNKYITNKEFLNENYFSDYTDCAKYKQCKTCQGYTKNEEFCYFCA